MNELELKIVLIKVKSNEAKLFQEWILRYLTITKEIVFEMIQFKHQLKINKKDDEVLSFKNRLKQQNLKLASYQGENHSSCSHFS